MHRALTLILMLAIPTALFAESGYDAWLRYAPLEDSSARRYRDVIPAVLVTLGTEAPVLSARDELVRGVRGMLNRQMRNQSRVSGEAAIVIGTLSQIRQSAPELVPAGNVEGDGFSLRTVRNNGTRFIVITAQSDRGVLYGSFAFLRRMAFGESVADLDQKESPYSPIRWINHWENLDGSIERGYGGRSIFWENGRARQDLSRVSDYGRLLASLGINGCSINNVNADPRVITSEFLPQIVRVAEALRPWGVKVVLAVDFGSPRTVGGLTTFDPLDPGVVAFWKNKVDEIYKAVPDLGGLVLKADSEGRIGPSAVGRTHADAANVIARALKPHGGSFFYRGFVYDNKMDWRILKNDRARAANDNFKDLDGKFDDNVFIQIKNGPIDFQVREPASPLFGNLEKTNQVIELQITQEYMGQARHTVYLVPMWKEVLDFDLRARPGIATPVKALASGRTFGRAGGFIGVSNVGLDDNWYGNHMSQANLYGFGRLAWNPDLSSSQIVDEWTRLTFGSDPRVLETIANIQLTSWRTYENYTGPLGLQTLTDIVGNHYGVAVEASERNGWGQWHRADEKGVGMDRSVATGTGFAGQFRPEIARIYETVENTPDDLLLFMHHVPYTQRLKSGKSVVQFIYDSHYDGADAVEKYVNAWKELKGRVDDRRYEEVLAQLKYQAGQAIVWRDAVAGWFYKMSKIPDARGRVGNYPGRIEAEAASLTGYRVLAVTPFEAASGEKAVECPAGSTCTATFKFGGQPGWYDLSVRYFDVNNGVARYRVRVAGQLLDEWSGTDRVPSRRVDSGSSARRIVEGVALRSGDEIQIEGIPEGGETAALDYIEIRAAN